MYRTLHEKYTVFKLKIYMYHIEFDFFKHGHNTPTLIPGTHKNTLDSRCSCVMKISAHYFFKIADFSHVTQEIFCLGEQH